MLSSPCSRRGQLALLAEQPARSLQASTHSILSLSVSFLAKAAQESLVRSGACLASFSTYSYHSTVEGQPLPFNTVFTLGVAAVVCRARLPPPMLASHRTLVPFPIQHLASVLGKSSGGWAKSLGPCTRMGDLDKAPGFHLAQPACGSHVAMNQGMGDLSLTFK